jgi:hypothetical protein
MSRTDISNNNNNIKTSSNGKLNYEKISNNGENVRFRKQTSKTCMPFLFRDLDLPENLDFEKKLSYRFVKEIYL